MPHSHEVLAYILEHTKRHRIMPLHEVAVLTLKLAIVNDVHVKISPHDCLSAAGACTDLYNRSERTCIHLCRPLEDDSSILPGNYMNFAWRIFWTANNHWLLN